MSDLDRGWRESRRRRWGFAGVPPCLRELGNRACFPHAPELCVEVLSPGNTDAEMREMVALCFDVGAHEVWLCAPDGRMRFLTFATERPLRKSGLRPSFSKRVELR
jgi:Uma2 family endonuclease